MSHHLPRHASSEQALRKNKERLKRGSKVLKQLTLTLPAQNATKILCSGTRPETSVKLTTLPHTLDELRQLAYKGWWQEGEEEDNTVEFDADDGSPMGMRACQIESSLSLKDLGDDSLGVLMIRVIAFIPGF